MTRNVPATVAAPPYPPEEMRTLVGPLDTALFDNPTGAPVFAGMPPEAYDSVLDFGCGCGRIARQLLLQQPRPQAYLGIDLHKGMIKWCQANLAPCAPGFRFEHHDAYYMGFNPTGSRRPVPFPVRDGTISLINAWSVFTHLVEEQTRHYLAECARALRHDGFMHCTWFLFDKTEYPMMQEFQNALFINDLDPANAVIFDRRWLIDTTDRLGLKLVLATPPPVRGYQWALTFAPAAHAWPRIPLPEDTGYVGIQRPPLLPAGAKDIGGG